MLKLQASSCVRSLSGESSCKKCELICPTPAITVAKNPLPVIDFSVCVACGACVAICPSEALILDEFPVKKFIFNFIEEKNAGFISCRKNIPCIAALNVEQLISVAILKKRIILDMGYCSECKIASTCQPQIVKNYEEATYILEAMQSDAQIVLKDIRYQPVEKEQDKNTRDILKIKSAFEREVQQAGDELLKHTLQKTDAKLLKQKDITDARKMLFASVKKLSKPSIYHVVDADELSFVSDKVIDEELCNACQECYRVCPSGALSSDIKNSKIDFDPFLCIKCNTCHDVCEPEAMMVSQAYEIEEFFKPSRQNLITFDVKNCEKCGMIFSTNFDEKLCHICQLR